MNVQNELYIEYSHVGVRILGVVIPRPERISPSQWLEIWDSVSRLTYDQNQSEIPSKYTENEG